MKVSVIVVAAGTGSRFGYERNKLFYPLCGEPVLTHTLRHIFAARSVSEVVIVHSRVDEKEIRRLVDDLHPIQPVRYALGGAEREDSVYNGLMAVSRDVDVVMVHDGARPFAGPDWYDQGAAMMETARDAIYGIPLKDTVKVRGGTAAAWSPPRRRRSFTATCSWKPMSRPGPRASRRQMTHPSSKPWVYPWSSSKEARRTAR